MRKKWIMLFLALIMLMITNPVYAQFDATISKAINLNYSGINKYEMTLKMKVFAITDWMVAVGVRGDSGTDYFITYKNGYGTTEINGENIVEYLNGNFYSASADSWMEVVAPQNINASLLKVSDSFSGNTAKINGIIITGNAVAVDAIGIVDNNGKGFIEDFSYPGQTQGQTQGQAFSQSGWELIDSTKGVAQIDTTYADQGYYSIRLMSTAYLQQTQQPAQTQQPVTQYPTQQYPYGTQYATSAYPYGTQYAASAYPYGTQYPAQQYPYGIQYAGQRYPYGTQYAGQQYPYGTQYAGQQYPYGTQYQPQYGYTGQSSSNLYGASSSQPGSPVYGYNPAYLQGGGNVVYSGQLGDSGQYWYSGQLGQTAAGPYGAAGYGTAGSYPMASPYAGGFQYPGAYSGGGFGALPYAQPAGLFGGFGASPFPQVGMPNLSFASPLGGVGLGWPAGGFGLGLPGSSLGLGGGLPGFSSFDPLGLAMFGGLF